MKFFRNRWVALFLAAAVVAGAALLNTRIMLDRECRQLEASFFQSETDVLTPDYYINSRIGTAAALAAIGDLYPDLAEETQALRDARRALVYAADAKDLSAMYDANGDLTAAGDAFCRAARQLELDPGDEEAVDDYDDSLQGAQRQLDRSSYNQEVQTLLRTVYYRFPGSFLARITGVQPPELYE